MVRHCRQVVSEPVNAPKPSPFGAPNFTPSVDTRVRTPILERRLTSHVLRRHDAVPSVVQLMGLDSTFPARTHY